MQNYRSADVRRATYDACSILIIALILPLFSSPSHALEISGNISTEGRFFFHDPLFPGQKQNSASVAVEPEFYHEWENSSVVFTPFLRLDSADPERSHFDIRELNWLKYSDIWELRAGIGKVFWGATEFVHLVDIINQTDLVENIDGEDKLGQPMVKLSMVSRRGVVDLFLLPYFRERTFPGEEGRLRSEFVVDTDRAEYESSAERQHVDFAVRYSHTLGDIDFGIYHFTGTGREPTLIPQIDLKGGIVLIPFYEQIDQTGVDVQMVGGNWLFKLESLYRTGQGDGFFAGAGGFEYTFFNVASSGKDIGLIGEWVYDERGEQVPAAFDNDLMFGARFALNDAAGTDTLIGIIQDADSRGSLLTFESGRRVGSGWKVEIDAFAVLDSSKGNPVYSLRSDDNIQVRLSYFF